MPSKRTLVYVAVFLAGVVLAQRVRALPGGNMLPSI